MKSWIYCNALGCFVIDESKKIVDSILLSEETAVQNLVLLEAGKTLDVQTRLRNKHPKAELITSSDAGVPLIVLAAFNDNRFLEKFRTIAMKRTKQKIAQSVKRDALIIQASNQMDELDVIINMMAKRLREWYELYNPEFSRATPDHRRFVEMIQKEERVELLKKIKTDEKYSMGFPLDKPDTAAMMNVAKKLSELYGLRDTQLAYVDSAMKDVCPNVLALCGASIGAKLLAIAGSLERLSMLPASTVQLLGAEKALFRHLKNKSYLPPKYGVLMNHPLVMKVKKEDRGKAARAVADKISIAAKVDYFKGKNVSDDLKRQLVERFGVF